MTFGGQTVGFVTVTDTGDPGYLGVKQQNKTVETLSGCHFRPLSATETPEAETDVTTDMWKLTAPPESAALAAKSTGQLVFDGTTTPSLPDPVDETLFQQDGKIMPKYDGGRVHHVTILYKRSNG